MARARKPSLLLQQRSDGRRRAGSARHEFAVREFSVPARAAELQHVRGQVREAAYEFGLGPTDRYHFVYAVNEAVTNAIQHGNWGPDATVDLRIDADGDVLICSVHDRGPFLNSPEPQDPLPEHGRGFAFMALLMDEVELSIGPHGTTVRLQKRRRATEANDGEH